MRRAAAALSLLVMQCLAKVEITRGTAITTLMHTRCPMNGIRWFGRRCGPGEKYKLGACLNSTRSIRWRRGPLTPNTRRKHAFVARRAARRRCAYCIISIMCWFMLFAMPVAAFPVHGSQTALPVGTELNEEALDRPREVFRSERLGGRKSYLVNLGDVAFSSPEILGGVARQVGISCSTCHVNGASNPKFYVPGLSTKPGNFITTGALFNAKANDRLLDPVTIPSLRGARFLAPYGHDGRTTSLRDFVRNVITNEFAGPEPSPAIVDAMVVYIQDIDFLPNPNLGPGGRLTAQAGAAERRGETLFARPFPHDQSLSCAGCHIPSAAFVDHLQHDVGSGGFFKTPNSAQRQFQRTLFP